MKYDDVLSQLGDFGRYQQIVYTAICIPLMIVAMQLMSPVFILAVPKYRCALPGVANDTYYIQDSGHAELINIYIPTSDTGDYSKCLVYTDVDNNTVGLQVAINDTIIRQIQECDRWVYDQSVYLDTVITETDLVCTRTIYRAHATMAMNVGGMIGYLAIGAIADRFGRKHATMGELAIMGLFSCLLLWVPNIYVFIVIRLFIGFGFGVFYNSCYIYAMEIIGPSKRTLGGMLQNFFWAGGILILSALGYFIRSWRTLQLVISIPMFAVLLYWWYLPKSGRWLLSMGQKQQCQQIFKRMAEVNKKNINIDIMPLQLEDTEEPEQQSFWKIFTSRTLAIRTLIVFWNWYTVSLLYFGLSLNVGNLSGDIYSNFAISCVMEVVGYALCFPGLYLLKRKIFYCSSMILGGLVVLASIFPQMYGTDDTKWSIILLAMVGKLVSSAAFATIYLFSAELFPTVIRSRTMGISAAFATLGGMTAPYIVELVNLIEGHVATILPFLIFGLTSLSAGTMSLVLPETQDAELPDTIEEMKQLGKRRR